jgi:hypothetical protein
LFIKCWKMARAFSKSKRHDVVFKKSILCSECSLLFITFFDKHQVTSSSKIDLGINLGLV